MSRGSSPYGRVFEVFDALRGLPADRRQGALREACGGDTELEREVAELLASLDTHGADAFSEEALVEARRELERLVPDDSPAAETGERSGDTIDRYRLLEVLGQGGMGTVWLAEQSAPVQRLVALKIIKLGMDTRQVVQRFEAERQALALMDHPHIAKVLDGGATASGRPYFVMERVEGVPITRYCETAELGLEERLRLFVRVCHAIQHAHHKGVIHRDIKPSNVLVSEQDGRPSPRVIDFGIAKATGLSDETRSRVTDHAHAIGTPEYMAPEQADAGALDVDTRADVYSLGVLLYELLTGTRPFELAAMGEGGYLQLIGAIRETPPQKPSTRAATPHPRETGSAPSLSSRPWSAHLRGDLDWVALKALEKDRARRYETAAAFAADIERFLAHQPVEAVPPSALYRLRKFVQRRRKTVVSLAVITVLLVAGSFGTGLGLVRALRANRELDRANAERELAFQNEQRQRERAQEAEAETRARAAELEDVVAFQVEQLGGIDVRAMGDGIRASVLEDAPAGGKPDLERRLLGVNFTNVAMDTLRENLFERSLAAIDRHFADRPLVAAELRHNLATTMMELGFLSEPGLPLEVALETFRTRLGPDDPRTLTVLGKRARLLMELGEWSLSEPLWRECWEGLKRLHGPTAERTLVASAGLGAALVANRRFEPARAHFEEALEACRAGLGEDHAVAGLLHHNRGGLQAESGELSAAEASFRRAYEIRTNALGETHPHTLASRSTLAACLLLLNRYDEAESHLRSLVADQSDVLGDDHPETLITWNNLSSLLDSTGRRAEAVELQQEGVERARTVLGADHPALHNKLSRLGNVLHLHRRFEESESALHEALEGRRRVLGDEHPLTLKSMHDLASCLLTQNKFDEAAPWCEASFEGRLQAFGHEHPDTLLSANNLAETYRLQGRLEDAEDLFRRTVEANRRVLGPDDLEVVISLSNLGGLLWSQGRFEEAEPFWRENAQGRRRIQGPLHPETLQAVRYVGMVLRDQERYDEALPYWTEAAEGLRQVLGPGHPQTVLAVDGRTQVLRLRAESLRASSDTPRRLAALSELAADLMDLERPDAAEPALAEAVELAAGDETLGALAYHRALGRLAACLVRQGRFAEAEPLCLEVGEWCLGARADELDLEEGAEMLEALVELYLAWDRSAPGKGLADQAETWRIERTAWLGRAD